MTLIKVCGITRIEDAEVAIEAGVDILGFIFTSSPRQISSERARRIIKSLRGKALFAGVFSQEDPVTILEIAHYCKLDLLQIHNSQRIIDFQLQQFPLLKLLQIEKKSDLQPLYSKSNFTWLLEGLGSSKMVPLELLSEICGKRFFLAGGLNVNNIEDYLKVAQPLGVDVCRGVELEPGYKSEKLINDFVRRVKLWDRRTVISDNSEDGLFQKFWFNR